MTRDAHQAHFTVSDPIVLAMAEIMDRCTCMVTDGSGGLVVDHRAMAHELLSSGLVVPAADVDAECEALARAEMALAERDATIARVERLYQNDDRYWVENDDLPGGASWCIPTEEIRRALDGAS